MSSRSSLWLETASQDCLHEFGHKVSSLDEFELPVKELAKAVAFLHYDFASLEAAEQLVNSPNNNDDYHDQDGAFSVAAVFDAAVSQGIQRRDQSVILQDPVAQAQVQQVLTSVLDALLRIPDFGTLRTLHTLHNALLRRRETDRGATVMIQAAARGYSDRRMDSRVSKKILFSSQALKALFGTTAFQTFFNKVAVANHDPKKLRMTWLEGLALEMIQEAVPQLCGHVSGRRPFA
ncbi:expressed unknown protein [Seminavis robusta]|uniref:Uncharacterized protein n=1 Tax=Seminavis robusta TaxID=568900 RepID=A0A9N8HTK8_9STRA|nr:expressed unknown protein [Seminavis robusta]|eukprot:Sro1287_g259450.1 n/a (235) ;mRNA; r:8361-9065